MLVITDDATIIRVDVDKINLLGRAAQGVRIMRPAAGSHVISIETTEKNPDEEQELVDAPIEAENTPETDGE